jgi:molybdopterin synthase catalytic subunit
MNDFLLSTEPLLVTQAQQLLNDATCGGQVIFVGTVRNHTKGKAVAGLHFEAYEAMVLLELEKIAEEITAKWPVTNVVLHHRLGYCAVGHIPVIAAVGAAHRQEAFEACAYLMDRLKQTVPIWKKELFEDGEEWVTPNP